MPSFWRHPEVRLRNVSKMEVRIVRESTLRFLLLLSIFLSGAAGTFALPMSSREEKPLENRRIENVHLKAKSLESLLARLAFSYEIPIGFEGTNQGESKPSYRLDFKQGTVTELLTLFATQHEEYTWEIQEGVVTIFPRDKYRDVLIRQILSTEIENFSIKEKTTCWAFANDLFSTPEVRDLLEANGSNFDMGYIGGFYLQQLGQKFSINFSRKPASSILNQVIRDSPVARVWIMRRDLSTNTVSLRISAEIENIKKPSQPARN